MELLALVGFAASYTWLMWPHPASQGAHMRAHSWHSLVLLSMLSVLVLVLSLADGPAWLWLFIGLSAIAGVLLSMYMALEPQDRQTGQGSGLTGLQERAATLGGPWRLAPSRYLVRPGFACLLRSLQPDGETASAPAGAEGDRV